jgi:hypothetical protein
MFKLSFVLLILVELLAINVKAFFCFVDIDGIVGLQCLSVLLFCCNNSTNINKTKESLNIDGQQFHQYQQNQRKFKH